MGLDCHHDNIMFFLQSSEHYTNLRESFLELRLQLVKEDGTDVVHRGALDDRNKFPEGADYGVVPINNIAHSLFSYVELTLNDNVLCSEPLYAYKALIQSLFTYSNATKSSSLQDLSGWRDDTPGFFENEKNKAFEWGSDKQCLNSKIFSVVMYPCLDLFQQDRLLPNLVGIKLNLHRNSQAFCIMNTKESRTTKYKIVIKRARFHLYRSVLSSDTFIGIERSLASGNNLIYPVKSLIIKPSTIAQGKQFMTIDTMFANQYIPERLILTFVEQSSYVGKMTKNPFNFQHFEISECSIDVLGQTRTQKFEWDRVSKQNTTIVPYQDYIRLLSQRYPEDSGFGISKNAYENGNFFICFDLSPDESFKTGTSTAGVKGNIILNLRFSEQLSSPIVLLAMGVYDNVFQASIDRTFTKPFVY